MNYTAVPISGGGRYRAEGGIRAGVEESLPYWRNECAKWLETL
jgi:hypothetical protein